MSNYCKNSLLVSQGINPFTVVLFLTLCLQQFQELEEQRIAYLRHQKWTYTNLLSKCTVDVDSVSVVCVCVCLVCVCVCVGVWWCGEGVCGCGVFLALKCWRSQHGQSKLAAQKNSIPDMSLMCVSLMCVLRKYILTVLTVHYNHNNNAPSL